jgi:hypothetical protein
MKTLWLVVLTLGVNRFGVAGTTTINQASGFTGNQAWSSLTNVLTRSSSQDFSAWEEGGQIHFCLTITGSGVFEDQLPAIPHVQSGQIFVTQVMSRDLHWLVEFEPVFSLIWSAGSSTGVGWYSQLYVTPGIIERFGPQFGPTEDGSGWLAGVYLQGSFAPTFLNRTALPEPWRASLFILATLLNTRRRGGCFIFRVICLEFFLG